MMKKFLEMKKKIFWGVIVLIPVLLFQSCANNDEQLRKEIVGTYSVVKTMIEEEGTMTMEGTSVFTANGRFKDDGIIIYTLSDEEGGVYRMKLQYSATGKYSIKNSIITYDMTVDDIDINVIQSDSYELTQYFKEHGIPEFKHEMCVDNTEKILELTDKYLKTEDKDDEGKKITLTYLKK
jgi:hypothetical protein